MMLRGEAGGMLLLILLLLGIAMVNAFLLQETSNELNLADKDTARLREIITDLEREVYDLQHTSVDCSHCGAKIINGVAWFTQDAFDLTPLGKVDK